MFPLWSWGDSDQVAEKAQIAIVGYPSAQSGRLTSNSAEVLAFQADFGLGRLFLELLGPAFKDGTQGGPVIDRGGRVVGVRVATTEIQRVGLPVSLGGYAVVINEMKLLLPRFQAGLMKVGERPRLQGDPSAPPGFPAIYDGSISYLGGPAPEGTLLYGRVRKDNLADFWVSKALISPTRYLLAAGPPNIYTGGSLEFWILGVKAQQTLTFLFQDRKTIDLVFPTENSILE